MEAAARWQRDSGRTNQEAFLNLRDVQFGVSGAAFIKCRIIPVMQSTKPTNCTIEWLAKDCRGTGAIFLHHARFSALLFERSSPVKEPQLTVKFRTVFLSGSSNPLEHRNASPTPNYVITSGAAANWLK